MYQMSHYERSLLIDCPVEKAFGFHSDTNNLKKITPAFINVKLIQIDLPLRLESEIILEDNAVDIGHNGRHDRRKNRVSLVCVNVILLCCGAWFRTYFHGGGTCGRSSRFCR